VAAGDLDTLVPRLLSQNDFKRTIPLSTTIYAFNRQSRRGESTPEGEETDHMYTRSLGKTALG